MGIYSVYGDAYFLVSYAVGATTSIGCLLAACFVLVPSCGMKRTPTLTSMRVFGSFLLITTIAITVTLSVLSSFEYASPVYTSLASAFLWLVMTIPIVFSWSPDVTHMFSRQLAAERRQRDSAASTKQHTPKSDEDRGSHAEEMVQITGLAEGHAGALAGAVPSPLNTHHGDLRHRKNGGQPLAEDSIGERSSVQKSPPLSGNSSIRVEPSRYGVLFDYMNHLCIEMKPHLRVVVDDITKRKLLYILMVAFGWLLSGVVISATYGICVCTQPKEINTWMQRKTTKPICPINDMCHVYPLLGKDCTELVIVAHTVLVFGDSVVSAQVDYRCSATTTSSTSCPPQDALGKSTQMVVFPHDDIREDARFIVAGMIPLASTTPTMYNITVTIRTASGLTITNPVAMQTSSIACQTPQEGLTFIGGGDYRARGVGENVVRRGMINSPNASFFFIGGDLAYANNLRRCYRRWDLFFQELLRALRRPNGAILPILATPGNHEGGGYLQAANNEERWDRFVFYARYFPHYLSTATDLTISTEAGVNDKSLTFHSHAIGDTLALLALDSDIMVSAAEQIPFIFKAAAQMYPYQDKLTRQAGETLPFQNSRRLIPFYHNPAYASLRGEEDTISTSVRTNFVPTFESLNKNSSGYVSNIGRTPVALVFEHHDHTYKRTVPIKQGAATTMSSGGIVYIGDGALGATPSSNVVPEWYLEKAENSNYVLETVTFRNGTVIVTVFREDGSIMDRFEN